MGVGHIFFLLVGFEQIIMDGWMDEYSYGLRFYMWIVLFWIWTVSFSFDRKDLQKQKKKGIFLQNHGQIL
jgi:hypothetical protein